MDPERLILFAKTMQLFATNLLILMSRSLSDVGTNPGARPGFFYLLLKSWSEMIRGRFSDGCSDNCRKQSVRRSGGASSLPASALQRAEECVHV